MIDAIRKLIEKETAGDPISGVKWTRKTTEKIAWQLKLLGIAVSRNTVGRLLRQMKYCLRTNRKTISAGSTSDRDRQFRYLCRQRNQLEKRGDPVLSVDAKKRELIGNFKNSGANWEQTATAVNDHDFRSAAKGIAIPFGPNPHRSTPVPLGWTHISRGVILPFADVDCQAISGLIQKRLLAMPAEDRKATYGRALGRVVAHELYHIFANTVRHSFRGVGRSSFTVRELLSRKFQFEADESLALRASKAHEALEFASFEEAR